MVHIIGDDRSKGYLTYVGTRKLNKVIIPTEFRPDKYREVESALYGFARDMQVTLLSIVPKPKTAVVNLASLHSGSETDPE